MIIGHLNNIEEIKKYLNYSLQAGLEYIQRTDFCSMDKGKYIIDADNYATVDSYQTKIKNEKRAESHVKYIDIQYIVDGTELIGHSFLSKENRVDEDLLIEKDLLFYKNVLMENDIILTTGMFAIFFPWDVHRPGCAADTPDMVKKVVVKIKA